LGGLGRKFLARWKQGLPVIEPGVRPMARRLASRSTGCVVVSFDVELAPYPDDASVFGSPFSRRPRIFSENDKVESATAYRRRIVFESFGFLSRFNNTDMSASCGLANCRQVNSNLWDRNEIDVEFKNTI
jgi:hypothetical protein